MAAISLGSIATGLPKDLVQRLVDAEREPIRKLEARKQNEEAKLKLAQEVSGKVSGMSSAVKDLTRFRSFRDLMAVNGKPELMDVAVDKNLAEPGSYQIEVKQLAGRSSMMSNALPDPDETEIGAGYFSYTLPNGDVKEVYVDSDNSTLNGLAHLINNQKDLDLTAIVVNDGVGDGSDDDPHWRLIVSHNKPGEANDAEFPDFYFLDGDEDFYMDKEKIAQNSVVSVNGFDVEFEGNKINSLLPGVTIDLKDAAPGKEFTLKIQEDVKSVKGKVEALVQKLNEVLGFIQKQNNLDKDSNTSNTLGGDITLQTLEYKVRQLVQTPLKTDSGPIRIADLGVVFNRSGLLDFNGDKLEHMLNENFNAVSQFFVGSEDGGDGFANQVAKISHDLTEQEGVVQSRVAGIQRRIRDIDNQIDTKERQVATTEKNLKEKFAKLESTMARLKAQQASVQSTLGGASILPGI